jgi:hypothetical protein
MNFFDTYEDPLAIADPDYGDEGTPLWERPDFWESDSDEEFDQLMRLEEDGMASGFADLLYLPEDAQDLPGASSLRRAKVAFELMALRYQTSRAQLRADAAHWAFHLEGTFLATEQGSEPSSSLSPLAGEGALYSSRGMDVQLWLGALPTFRRTLQDLTLWVRGACLFALPDDVLGDIIHMAWEFFCATLLFPRTRIAFETFSATPVSTPEEARFRLPGVGPFGPPPPAHVPPFLGRWEAEHVFISPDDMVDLNSAAVAAIPILGSITDWVVEAPVAALPSATLGEVSCLAWELFIASLRIPRARSEFDALCSDPPALREAAGLVLTSLTASVEDVPSRPHPRSNRRRARR